MSEKVKKETFPIIKEILARIEGGDEGNMYVFFSRMVRDLQRNISKISGQLKAEEDRLKLEISAIEDKIEDAEELLVDTYFNIDTDMLKGNSGKDNYAKVYLEAIDKVEKTINKLKEELAETKDTLALRRKDAKADIVKIEHRISELKKTRSNS